MPFPCLTLCPTYSMSDIHVNPRPTAKYACPVCARDVTSREVCYRYTRCSGWVHAKCSGLLNVAQYQINKNWTCDPCSASKTQQSIPPPPSPSSTLLHLPNKIVMTARSTFYSSTLMDSATH